METSGMSKATLSLNLNSDSGYCCEETHRIDSDQWEKIQRVIHKTEHPAPAPAGEAEPVAHDFEVCVGDMHESNGRVTWFVHLVRAGGSVLDGYQVYSDAIQGRAEYEAATLRHFLGIGPKPDFLAFDTDPAPAPASTDVIQHLHYTTGISVTVELIKSQLDQVCELYKLPKYTALLAAQAGEAEPVGIVTAEGYWEKLSITSPRLPPGTKLYAANPAPAPASPEGKRFNDATLLQIAAVRPDLIPEMCAPAPSSPDVHGLIAELNAQNNGCCQSACCGKHAECMARNEAATALATLQSQNAQQAERIKELEEALGHFTKRFMVDKIEAQLAEAVGLLNHIEPQYAEKHWMHNTHKAIAAFLEKVKA